MKITELKFVIGPEDPIGMIAEVDALVREFFRQKRGSTLIKCDRVFGKGYCTLLYECTGATQDELSAFIKAPEPAMPQPPTPTVFVPANKSSPPAEVASIDRHIFPEETAPVSELASPVAKPMCEQRPASETHPGSFLFVAPGLSLVSLSKSDLGDALGLKRQICEIEIGGFRYIVNDASSIAGEALRPCLEIIALLKKIGGAFSPSAVRGTILIYPVEGEDKKATTYLLECIKEAISSLVQLNRGDATIVRTEIEDEEFYREYMNRLWGIEPGFRQYHTEAERLQMTARAKGILMSCVFTREFLGELSEAGFELEFQFTIEFETLSKQIFKVLSTKTRPKCLKFWHAVSCRTEDAIRETRKHYFGLKEGIKGALILLDSVGYNPLFVAKYKTGYEIVEKCNGFYTVRK